MRFDTKGKNIEAKVDMHRAPWSTFHFDGNTFEVKTEPGAQAMRYPTPNQIVGHYNPAYEVTYLGEMNEADMTVPDATLKVTGPEWKIFDVGVTDLSFNYLGLGLRDSKNDAYNKQFKAVMLESLSAAYASQFTTLAFMENCIETDIPQITGVVGTGNNAVYDGSGQIGFTVFYQAVVQSVAAVFAKYNTLLSYADYMIQCGYNYEAPYTTQLLNLFKKQNVFSLFDQLGTIMQQEYLDLAWYRESTVLNSLISKVDQGVQTPNLSIVANHIIPHVRVKTKGSSPSGSTGTIFSTFPSDTTDAYSKAFNQITIKSAGSSFTGDLETLIMTTMRLMDIETILEWARNVQSGNIPTDPNTQGHFNSVDYINAVIDNLHKIIDTLSVFRTATVDFKTFLMVLQSQTNLNRWIIGTPYLAPSRPREQRKPAYFKIIEDIFTAIGMGGPITYDENSRKWKVITPWFNSVGIAGYDAYDGGFTIATSVRIIPTDNNGYTDTKYLFPVMFSRYKERVYSNGTMVATTIKPEFLNRIGATFSIQNGVYTAQQLAQNIHFSFLNLTGSSDVSLTVPEATLASYTTDVITKSTAMKCLLTVYGVGCLIEVSGNTTIRNEVLDPDIIGLVGREFGSFSTDSVNYVTGRAPLRQSDREVNLGFASSALTKY